MQSCFHHQKPLWWYFLYRIVILIDTINCIKIYQFIYFHYNWSHYHNLQKSEQINFSKTFNSYIYSQIRLKSTRDFVCKVQIKLANDVLKSIENFYHHISIYINAIQKWIKFRAIPSEFVRHKIIAILAKATYS